MQDILEQYQHITENDDIFTFWEQELSLRTALRQRALTAGVTVNSSIQVDFLYRSLYWAGRRYDFFKIIFSSLHFMPVLQWLVNAPVQVMNDFLRFLPWYILNSRMKPAELEFMVRIYREEYRPAFAAIINTLDQDSCIYLSSRTANADLRRLLRDRQVTLQQMRMESCYGLEELSRHNSFPTFYGDKVQLIRDTLEKLQNSQAHNFPDPYQADRFLLQLEAAGMVFKCGLAEDSLAFLLDIYRDYQQKNRLVEIINDQKIYKGLQQLLRAVIPVYSLVYEPLQAYNCACRLYERYFPLISPEAAPLQYLQLWEVITAGFSNDSPDNLRELLYTAKKAEQLRPAELPLLMAEETENWLNPQRLKELLENSEAKFHALPHEAFVVLELIRLLQYKKRATLDGETASRLLSAYLLLWQWLPCRLFMHSDLLDQIGPLVDGSIRYQAQRIVNSLHTMTANGLKSELAARPQLFRSKDESIRRAILAGRLMGAL
jgi:hypothetical protein